MQIPSKKDITLSPATGTAVVVRKGNIAKWDAGASFNLTAATSGYQQIGSALKLTSTGKPVRIRVDAGSQIGDGVTQQVAGAQSFIKVEKYVNGVDIRTISKAIRQVTDTLQKLYANGNINDYLGSQQCFSVNIVDEYTTDAVDGDTVEYRIFCFNQYLSASVNTTNLKHSIQVYSFEIEEVQ